MGPGLLFQAQRHVALRVARLEISDWHDALVLQSEYGGDGFQRAGGAERVAVQGFCRGDFQVMKIGGEDVADGGGFGDVVGGGAGAVGVDDADGFRRQDSVGERQTQRPGGADGGGLGELRGIGAHAEAGDMFPVLLF